MTVSESNKPIKPVTRTVSVQKYEGSAWDVS
jgi:hypothetical protein